MPYAIRSVLFFALFGMMGPSWGATVVNTIRDFSFNPKRLTINQGDTVQWINDGSVPHTTTSGKSPAPNGKWDSGTLPPGGSFSRQFKKGGKKFRYFCTIHPNMTGVIIVRAPGAATRVDSGLAIAPVPLTYAEEERDLVGLGSYIVNSQARCAECHSCSSCGPQAAEGETQRLVEGAYLAGGVAFGPGIVSANLTPEPGTGNPAGLTFDAFKHLFRGGRSASNHDSKVMPWASFGAMTDADLAAIYEYLRAIPPATMPVPACAAPGQ